MTTGDPNVITVNGAVLSPMSGGGGGAGQHYQVGGGPVQTYYTTTSGEPVGVVTPVTAAPTPIVVGKKSKATPTGSGGAGRTVLQTVQQQPSAQTNVIDVKNVTPLPQAVLQQIQAGNWTTTNQQPQTVNLISTDQGWSTIKLENAPGTVVQTTPSKAGSATLNPPSGLQFISAGPGGSLQMAAAAQPTTTTVQPPQFVVAGPGGRKTGTIIETFKCEVCNQVFQSMGALQNHVSSIHEAPSTPGKKGGKGKGGGGGSASQPALHCEYKYSGGANLDDTITVLQSPGGQTIQLMPQGGQGQLTTSPGQNVATPLTVMTANNATIAPGNTITMAGNGQTAGISGGTVQVATNSGSG